MSAAGPTRRDLLWAALLGRDGRRPMLVLPLLAAVLSIGYGIWKSTMPIVMGGLVLAFTVCWIGTYLDGWTWTGFGPFKRVKTSDNEEFERGKTLWDGMQLVIVPLVLSLLVFWLNDQQRAADQVKTEQQAEDGVLGTFIDHTSDALMKGMLHVTGKTGCSVTCKGARIVLRARTVTAIRRLDDSHTGLMTQFLNDSGLLPVLDLSRVDLSGAQLWAATLPKVNLRTAILSYADLRYAFLSGAHLEGATLVRARLTGARMVNVHLEGADLERAAMTGVYAVAAHLGGAGLQHANLTGADLSVADLTGAHLDGAHIARVKWSATTCPDGTNSASNNSDPESCSGHIRLPAKQGGQ